MIRRDYSQDFKKIIINEVKKMNRTSLVGIKYGIPEWTIRTWIKDKKRQYEIALMIVLIKQNYNLKKILKKDG